MSSDHKPELISFKVCPFVQRSAITLNEKKIDFKTTYIDLKNVPDWFSKLSPLGKVPVLKVSDTVIFESAVIAEYLDECYAPQLHPKDLLAKAKHRSWTEFASDITMNMYTMLSKPDAEGFNAQKNNVIEQLSQVENELDDNGPFFAGETFSLVDTAYAPLFLRLHLINNIYPLDAFSPNSKLARWSNALLQRPSVQKSVVDDFETLFLSYTKNSGGYIGQQMP